MIKKIVIFTMVLLVMIVTVVYGDAGGAPRSLDGKIIDIEVKTLSDEISIGEQATLEVTITNLTQENVQIVRMNFGIFWFKIDYHGYMLSIDTDELKLGAYESVTFQITDEVSSHIDWYKEGTDFFTDIETQINFYIRNSDGRITYYQEAEEIIPLKIRNLYDGSKYIEIEWLDDRDTMYYREYLRDDYYDDGGSALLTRATVYYEMSVKNKSSAEIYDIAPYTEGIIHDSFSDYVLEREIDDDYIFNLDSIFYVDGNYYCIEKSRTYDTQFIEKPNVSVDISPAESDDESLATKYIITMQNSGDKVIQNFMVRTRKRYQKDNDLDYEKLANLEPGKAVSLEYHYFGEGTLGGIYFGYLLDGMFIWWYADIYTKTSDTGEITVEITHEEELIGTNDYEYDKRMEEGAASNLVSPTYTSQSTPESTPNPTTSVTFSPTPQAEIVITKHQNPMFWALIVVALLLIGAMVFIIRAMGKVTKSKEEDKDD